MTTSPGPGQLPSTSVSGLKRESPFAMREAEVRRAAVDDRLAVVADQLRLAVDAALGRGDARDRAHLRRAATRRSSGAGDAALVREVEGRLAGDDGVEPWRTSVKIESNALSIESVRT